MHIVIKSETRRYHVAFKQDTVKRFKKGPNKGRPQTVTTCEIFLMTGASGPTLISSGVTTLGRQDKPDSLIGCKEAFERALSTTYFSKRETTAFWKEFHKRHKRIDTVKVGKPSCAEAFSNYGGMFSEFNPFPGAQTKLFAEKPSFYTGGPVHGYGGLHSFQKEAIRKLRAAPIYHRAVRAYANSKTTSIRKIAGLGWSIFVNEATGEVIQTRPRTEAQKLQQLRDMYAGPSIRRGVPAGFMWDKPHETITPRAQAEGRCHRVGKPITIVNVAIPAKALSAMMGGAGAGRVRGIIAEADRYKRLRDLCAVADDGLTAHMRSMQLLVGEKADKLDTELLSRPGITKVLGEYIIDADVFVSAFKVDDVVTFEDGLVAKVIEVDTIRVTIQPIRNFGYTMKFGPTQTVMDWEVKKHVGRLRRFWTWLRALAKIHREDSLPEAVVKPNVPYVHSLEHGKISGRELWEVIDRDHCPSCGRIGEFLQGPRGGSCLNIKCILCNQKYWVDPLSRTAKKLDD